MGCVMTNEVSYQEQSYTNKSSTFKKEVYFYDHNRALVLRKVFSIDGGMNLNCMKLPPNWDYNINAKDSFDILYLQKKSKPRCRSTGGIIRCADLFCGCGGLSLGVWEACRALGKRFESSFAIDNDNRNLSVYKKNFPGGTVLNKDVQEIFDRDVGKPPSKNENALIDNIGNIDILVSGPPCQGHSNLNNHTRRNDVRNELYIKTIRFAELFNVPNIIIENVPQIQQDKRKSLDKSIRLLSDMGYFVCNSLINLNDIGVPQKRKRHVLIASKLKKIEMTSILNSYRTAEKNIWWAIDDLEKLDPKDELDRPSRLSIDNMRRIDYLFDTDSYNLPNWARPKCHRKKHNYRSMYGRLRPMEPAPTITSGFLSPGQGRYIHPTRKRTITIHEAARIQFFPDFFDFTPAPNRESLKQMIGNAVPMKLSYIFALELLS